eukprot:Pompholyxophrys_punicea_v1_NODE_421_length_2007_cov_12.629098.p1 type:complete len:105 gc:universal NODE_421_length_2007_cov_12.629098:1025-711(-)
MERSAKQLKIRRRMLTYISADTGVEVDQLQAKFGTGALSEEALNQFEKLFALPDSTSQTFPAFNAYIEKLKRTSVMSEPNSETETIFQMQHNGVKVSQKLLEFN